MNRISIEFAHLRHGSHICNGELVTNESRVINRAFVRFVCIDLLPIRLDNCDHERQLSFVGISCDRAIQISLSHWSPTLVLEARDSRSKPSGWRGTPSKRQPHVTDEKGHGARQTSWQKWMLGQRWAISQSKWSLGAKGNQWKLQRSYNECEKSWNEGTSSSRCGDLCGERTPARRCVSFNGGEMGAGLYGRRGMRTNYYCRWWRRLGEKRVDETLFTAVYRWLRDDSRFVTRRRSQWM
jgi:hypothetical protein